MWVMILLPYLVTVALLLIVLLAPKQQHYFKPPKPFLPKPQAPPLPNHEGAYHFWISLGYTPQELREAKRQDKIRREKRKIDRVLAEVEKKHPLKLKG